MSQLGWRRLFERSWIAFMVEQVTLGDLAHLLVGFSFRSNHYSRDGADVRLLRGDNIGQGYLRWDNAARWAGADVPPEFALRLDDIVIAMDRPWVSRGLKFSRVGPPDLPSYLVQRVARLRAKPGVHQRYLQYVIASSGFTSHILAVQTGTAVPHVSGEQILAYQLVAHPPGQQQAIAEVLGALDDKIAANDRAIDVAEVLALTLAGSSLKTVTVSELARHSTAQLGPSGFDDTVAHYSLPAFDVGVVPEQASAASIKSSKFLLKRPAVLISKLNPRIPRVWDVVETPETMAVASTEFVVLEPKELSTSALWAVLSQPSTTTTLAGNVAGTSGSHQRVLPAEILALRVPDPRALAFDVLKLLDVLGQSIQALRVQNRRLAATRDELLPLLMSGRIRVKDATRVVEESSDAVSTPS